MAKIYWILNIDMKGSSALETSPENLQKISATCENFFRFVVLKTQLPHDHVNWSGDGGFAAFDSEIYQPSQVLEVAKYFTRYVAQFVSGGYICIDVPLNPTFRVTIGGAEVAASQRISNLSGSDLSQLLKYERDFGRENFISVLDNAHRSLGQRDKKALVRRPGEVRHHAVYDISIGSAYVPAELYLSVLTAKEEIDTTTLTWFTKCLANTRKYKSIKAVVSEVFNYQELMVEIIRKIYAVLSENWTNVAFRVAYARPINRKAQKIFFALASSQTQEKELLLEKNRPLAASVAWNTGKPVFIEDTAEEEKKKRKEFERLYPTQNLSPMLSMAALPVINEQQKPDCYYGTLCIDASSVGFFRKEKSTLFEKLLRPMITEVLIAEIIKSTQEKLKR